MSWHTQLGPQRSELLQNSDKGRRPDWTEHAPQKQNTPQTLKIFASKSLQPGFWQGCYDVQKQVSHQNFSGIIGGAGFQRFPLFCCYPFEKGFDQWANGIAWNLPAFLVSVKWYRLKSPSVIFLLDACKLYKQTIGRCSMTRHLPALCVKKINKKKIMLFYIIEIRGCCGPPHGLTRGCTVWPARAADGVAKNLQCRL